MAPKKYWDLYKREEVPLASFQKFAESAPKFAYHNSNELRSYGGIPASGSLVEAKQRELIHGYYACTSYIDAQIGMILDELEKRDLMKNTIIVLWGDHGWHLGDHGIWCKHTNYEQATRSPLIFSGPGVSKGFKTNAPTEFVDIFPTLCDLAGIPMLDNLDGLSAMPVLTQSKPKVRDFAISQFGRGKAMGYALRNEQYRYIVWPIKEGNKPSTNISNNKGEELYDYASDPLEKKNIAGDPAQSQRIVAFRAVANTFLKEQAERIAKEPVTTAK